MTTTQLTPDQVRDHALAVLGHAPAHLAADIADQFAATVFALHPGAVVGSDVGVVRHCPDSRFPGEPFVRDGDETRWSLKALGDVYLLGAELVAGATR